MFEAVFAEVSNYLNSRENLTAAGKVIVPKQLVGLSSPV